jgi:hypothetical protein
MNSPLLAQCEAAVLRDRRLRLCPRLSRRLLHLALINETPAGWRDRACAGRLVRRYRQQYGFDPLTWLIISLVARIVLELLIAWWKKRHPDADRSTVRARLHDEAKAAIERGR